MPSSMDLPDPGIEPASHALQVDSLPVKPMVLWETAIFERFTVSYIEAKS